MTASSSLGIPCLYNSFSFTPENIKERMLYYDTSSFRPQRVPSNYATTSLPLVVPVAVPSILPINEPQPQICESSASSSDDDSLSCSETDLSVASDVLDAPVIPSTPVSAVFDPQTMTRFAMSPSSISQAASSDSLLWIAYIMIYGIEKFEMVENHYTEANTFKFILVELIRKCKPMLKANKIKLSGVEENLVHKPFINMETLEAIAICKNMSVCIVQNRKYYEVRSGNGGTGTSTGTGVAIIEKIKGSYVLYICPEEVKADYLKYIREHYWLMESISAPIRPMSAYKLQDLVDISTKLGLSVVNIIPGKFGSMGTEKRKTKPELYEAICKCV
jgi:hypothetical protein